MARPDSNNPEFQYVYIIQSKKDQRWYTGCTGDLRKRLSEHNSGKFPAWTKGRGPFEIIYFEAYRNKKDAFNREKQLKSGAGKNYVKKRIRRFLLLSG